MSDCANLSFHVSAFPRCVDITTLVCKGLITENLNLKWANKPSHSVKYIYENYCLDPLLCQETWAGSWLVDTVTVCCCLEHYKPLIYLSITSPQQIIRVWQYQIISHFVPNSWAAAKTAKDGSWERVATATGNSSEASSNKFPGNAVLAVT